MDYFPVPADATQHPDANNASILVNSAIAMACLSTLAVGLRFLSRRLTNIPLLLDDWMILVALPFALMECSIDIYGPMNNHFGRHLQYSDPGSLRRFLQATFAFELAYNIAIILPKFSMLALYWRVFGFAFKWPLISTAILCAMFLVGASLAAVFSCIPVSGYWDIDIHSKCIDHLSYYIGQAVCNIAIDVILLFLPIIPIWRLQISFSQKIAVGGIFFIGIFVTLCSALRLNQLVITEHSISFDPTWSLVGAAVWSVVETNLSIVCVCLPSMRPLLRVLLHGSPNSARDAHSGRARGSHPMSMFTDGMNSASTVRQGVFEVRKSERTSTRTDSGSDLELGYHANITSGGPRTDRMYWEQRERDNARKDNARRDNARRDRARRDNAGRNSVGMDDAGMFSDATRDYRGPPWSRVNRPRSWWSGALRSSDQRPNWDDTMPPRRLIPGNAERVDRAGNGRPRGAL